MTIALTVAPACVVRGWDALDVSIDRVAAIGTRPLVVGGAGSLRLPEIQAFLERLPSAYTIGELTPDCCETSLANLQQQAIAMRSDVIIGVGGGKAMDGAKLLAHRLNIPVITIPTSAATCAAWTALSNIYTPAGGYLYDVGLAKCPELLILDYRPILAAPPQTLIAGIGDAIAKWYEASISSSDSPHTLIIAAVQQARVLRDLLFQKSAAALAHPGQAEWQEVVDATVLLAGVIGGLGGAQCRTVAAHAVHNGLTHLKGDRRTLHGEKVAYGILVQSRLVEMVREDRLAVTARMQLLDFYTQIGLPVSLADLGLGNATPAQLELAAELACHPKSDLHHLPFTVAPAQLITAMRSTADRLVYAID